MLCFPCFVIVLIYEFCFLIIHPLDSLNIGPNKLTLMLLYQLTLYWIHCCLDSRESKGWSECNTARFVHLKFCCWIFDSYLYYGAKMCEFCIVSVMGGYDCFGWSCSSFSLRRSKHPSSYGQTWFNVSS